MICIPIVSPTMKEALADIAAAEAIADFIELRIDLISKPDLPLLLETVSKPCIVTNRSKMEGGQFKGSHEKRIAFLLQAIELEADYVDIETSTPGPLLKSVLECERKTQTILSHHDFIRTPEQMNQLYALMCDFPADILKVVTYARDINDNLIIFDLLKQAQSDEKKMISFCMGEKGEISRILSPLKGSFLTFGSLDKGKESAPGQIPAAILKDVYRVNMERPEAKIYGVIGDPVSKSMGYLIHNRAFQEINSPDIYLPFLVENVEKFFKGFMGLFEGLSVTMPHKESILPLLDKVDRPAAIIGAVNTVVKEGNDWVGYNTDCTGAMQALEKHRSLSNKHMLIIGAGGTAKAIGHGAKERGANLTVTYNRNKEKGEILAGELNCNLISIRDVDQISIDVLVNCSPVGMNPNINESPFPKHLFHENMVVLDSVYNPMETRLLKDAKEAGATVISGIELFINQAVGQFELWTGQKAPSEVMREEILKNLEES